MWGCGDRVPDQQIIIVNPESLSTCAWNEVGEIWVSGPSITQGYWERPEETKEVFEATLADTGEGPFLRTGDLGFIQDNELYITGRLKDILIIRGQNYYPHDIEKTVEQSDAGLRLAAGATFSVEVTGEEQLVVIHEVKRHHKFDSHEEVVTSVREAIAEEHGLGVYAFVLIRTHSLLKTSSGKVKRFDCKKRYMEDQLNVIAQCKNNKFLICDDSYFK